MSHIAKAKLKPIFNGTGGKSEQLDLILSDGSTVSLSTSLSETAIITKIHDLAWLSGLELDLNLPDQVADIINEHWSKAPRGFILMLQMAIFRALSISLKTPLFKLLADYAGAEAQLPQPLITIFNGGRFGDTELDFDEFLLLPDTHNKKSLFNKLSDLALIRQAVGKLLIKSDLDTDIGSLGGYAPEIFSSLEALELMMAAAKNCEFNLSTDYRLGLNVGAWHLFDSTNRQYLFGLDRTHLQSMDLLTLYQDWLRKYNLAYLEDAAASDDVDGWKALGHELRGKINLVGNHFFNDRLDLLRAELANKSLNTAVVNPLAHASLSHLAEFCSLAKKNNYNLVLAAGVNETGDDWLADLAVGFNFDIVKFGSLARYEFVGKYNRLLAIEDYLAEAI